MTTPKIRHLALFARDPEKLAQFYEKAFEMKRVHQRNKAVFLSDGYLTLAILHAATNKGGTLPGLNHFGFKVDDRDAVMAEVVAQGSDEPTKRPDDRPYAEYRAYDLEGNMFDISQHGFEMVETNVERDQKEKVTA